jgi:3-dehydroquinate dehydratase-2
LKIGTKQGVEVRIFQSNGEGAIIDALHNATNWMNGIVLNAGGNTHDSIAIRDAIAAIKIPVIEVHLSNVHSREEFRHKSFIMPVCKGVIVGFGWRSYVLGLQGLLGFLRDKINK